jgi:hypothetical protein
MSGADELPDPDKGVYIFTSGRMNSGKSTVCRAWFDPYPYDRVVIDPTHDVRKDFRDEGVEFEELRGGPELPARLPKFDPQHPRTWVFCPDMGDPGAVDDMDRVVGLALGRGPTLLWSDEYGDQTTAHKTPPNMRRVLHHGRHDHLTFLVACPRPRDINGLAISQAHYVYTFRTPNTDDLEWIAKQIGYPPVTFQRINESLAPRGEHWHTMYDRLSDQLFIMPPLPKRRRGLNARVPVADVGELAPAIEADQLGADVRTARRG